METRQWRQTSRQWPTPLQEAPHHLFSSFKEYFLMCKYDGNLATADAFKHTVTITWGPWITAISQHIPSTVMMSHDMHLQFCCEHHLCDSQPADSYHPGKLWVFCQADWGHEGERTPQGHLNIYPTGQCFSSVWDRSLAFVWKEIFFHLLFFQGAWKPPHTLIPTLSSSLVGQTHACQHHWLKNSRGAVICFHLKPFKDS